MTTQADPRVPEDAVMLTAYIRSVVDELYMRRSPLCTAGLDVLHDWLRAQLGDQAKTAAPPATEPVPPIERLAGPGPIEALECWCTPVGPDVEGPAEDCEVHGELRSVLVEQRDEARRDVREMFGEASDSAAERDAALAELSRLTAELARYKAAIETLRDLADHGLRHDLNPTATHWDDAHAMYNWFSGYMRGADNQLRGRCKAALAAALGDGA